MTAREVIIINFSEIGKVEITCLKCAAALKDQGFGLSFSMNSN